MRSSRTPTGRIWSFDVCNHSVKFPLSANRERRTLEVSACVIKQQQEIEGEYQICVGNRSRFFVLFSNSHVCVQIAARPLTVASPCIALARNVYPSLAWLNQHYHLDAKKEQRRFFFIFFKYYWLALEMIAYFIAAVSHFWAAVMYVSHRWQTSTVMLYQWGDFYFSNVNRAAEQKETASAKEFFRVKRTVWTFWPAKNIHRKIFDSKRWTAYLNLIKITELWPHLNINGLVKCEFIA